MLAFARAGAPGLPSLICAVNFSGTPVQVSGYGEPIAASEPLTERDGQVCLPIDAAVWFEQPSAG